MVNTNQLSRENLDRFLQASKDPFARNAEVIPHLHALHHTATALLAEVRTGTENSEQICDDLIQALRVLRNACAAGQAVCTALLSLGSVDLLADTIDTVGVGAAALNWTLPAVAAQFLANFTNAGGPECATAAWHRLFPIHLTKLAHVDSCPAQEATALTILTCCKTVNGAAEALSGPEGAPAITAMLHANFRFAAQQQCNHSLILLLGHLVFRLNALLPVLMSLASSGEDVVEVRAGGWHLEDVADISIVATHSLLLQELAIEAQEAPLITLRKTETEAEVGQGTLKHTYESGCGIENGSMACLMALIRRLASHHLATSPSYSASPTENDGSLSAQHQLLQDALHLLRDICARNDDGIGLLNDNTSENTSISLIDDLLAAGLIPTIPAMLKSLGPINNPRREQPSLGVADLAPGMSQEAQKYVMLQPYEGYRSDLLAVLANAAHKRPAVQAGVTACGGVELVLAQCQVDEKSPLAREWALWAVRNLCEGSEAARDAIKELKACAALDSEELQRAGVKVTLDEESGKLKVEKREGRD